MKISRLIKILNEIKTEFGNLDVAVPHEDYAYEFEECEIAVTELENDKKILVFDFDFSEFEKDKEKQITSFVNLN